MVQSSGTYENEGRSFMFGFFVVVLFFLGSVRAFIPLETCGFGVPNGPIPHGSLFFKNK